MRRFKAAVIGAVVIGAGAVLAGCPAGGEVVPGDHSPGTVREAMSGKWLLTAIGTDNVDTTFMAMPTLELGEAGRIGGQSSVNHWSATLDDAALQLGELRMGAIITTLMAGSLEAMAVEHAYLMALKAARKIDLQALQDGTLRLLNENGEQVLRYRRP